LAEIRLGLLEAVNQFVNLEVVETVIGADFAFDLRVTMVHRFDLAKAVEVFEDLDPDTPLPDYVECLGPLL
jgi:hypothetical protein